jgi:hypothetical protein
MSFDERKASSADSGKVHAMNLSQMESTRSGSGRPSWFCKKSAAIPMVHKNLLIDWGIKSVQIKLMSDRRFGENNARWSEGPSGRAL